MPRDVGITPSEREHIQFVLTVCEKRKITACRNARKPSDLAMIANTSCSRVLHRLDSLQKVEDTVATGEWTIDDGDMYHSRYPLEGVV